jgi:predicted CoA-binding protein
MIKKTLVIGASEKTDRYSNLAIRRLRAHEHPVAAIGLKAGQVLDVEILTGHPAFSDIDTVSLYVAPSRQGDLYSYVLSLHPQRVIFNPGTENPEFEELLYKAGVMVEEACTLVLLSTGQF